MRTTAPSLTLALPGFSHLPQRSLNTQAEAKAQSRPTLPRSHQPQPGRLVTQKHPGPAVGWDERAGCGAANPGF